MSANKNQQLATQPIKAIECRRLFNLIQQNIKNPSNTLTLDSLQEFIKTSYLQNSPKTSHLRQILGQETTMEKFVTKLVSLTYDIRLSNENSLTSYYNFLKSIFFDNIIKPLEQFELWDHPDIQMNSETIEKIKSNIDDFLSKLLPYLEGMEIYTFQNSLHQINYCLSAIVVPNMSQQHIIKIYLKLVNTTVLKHTSSFISSINDILSNPNFSTDLSQQSQNITNYLNLICYLYMGSSLKEIKQKLSAESCLFYAQTYSTIVSLLNINSVKVKKHACICLALMAKYNDSFVHWLVSNNVTQSLNIFNNIDDNEGLFYIVVCLKHIVRAAHSSTNKSIFSQESVILVGQGILQFALRTLKTAQILHTQQQCLYLISEVIKIYQIAYPQLEEIKLTTKVYMAEAGLQSLLVPPSLEILSNSIIHDRVQIVQITIHDHGFLTCLQQNIQNKESPFYYQLFNIIYLLSQWQPKYLIDKVHILQKILNIILQDSNPALVSLSTQILLNIINYAVETETFVETLYEKYGLFDSIIPAMFEKCLINNNYLANLFFDRQNSGNIFQFDKTMLINIFETLYVLAVFIPRRHRRYCFSKKLNERIVESISDILSKLFKLENQALSMLILREKIIIRAKKAKSSIGIYFFKLISILFEEMTYGMESRNLQFLRMINNSIKNYSTALLVSQYFSVHQLEVENIPIYLNIELTYDSNKVTRTVPHKFQLSSVKCYMKHFIARILQIKEQQINDIKLRDPEMRTIDHEVQYRNLVNKQVEKRVPLIKLQVFDVKLRPKRQQIASSSYISVPGEALSRSMISDNRQNSFVGRQLPRGTSIMGQSAVNKLTPLREQPSQFHDQRKSYYSPINVNYTYREKSPVFGVGGSSHLRK